MNSVAALDVRNRWPRLPPIEAWQETCTTLHMWTQVVGNIRLALAPPVNHFLGLHTLRFLAWTDDIGDTVRTGRFRHRFRLR